MGSAGQLEEIFTLAVANGVWAARGCGMGLSPAFVCLCAGGVVSRAFAKTGALPQWNAVSGISTCGRMRMIVMSKSSKTSTAHDQRVMGSPKPK
jgi:hypothetical protein